MKPNVNAKWQSDFLASLIREISSIPMVEWADGVLQLPQSVRYPVFMAKLAHWLTEVGNAMSDDTVRRIDVRMPAGAAKSLLGEMFIGYVIVHCPGPLYYVWQTDDDGRDAMEDRLVPMLEGNESLEARMPADPRKRRAHKILLPGMPLYAVGANKSAAQSKRIRYLLMEEPHLYDAGMMRAFEKRCEGVPGAKIITLSTGSVLEDESDESYQQGTCEEFEVACPHCGKYQVMTDNKDRLKCDRTPDTVDADGNFIWPKLLATVRYNCEHCGVDWPRGATSKEDMDLRRIQSETGKYRATNPNAKPDHRSFHLEAPAVYWLKLEDIVEEKLKATYAARRGSLEPLKDYIQKRRAMAWDERPPEDSGDAMRTKSFYVKRSAVDQEISRQLTLDNQHGRASKGEGAHRWFTCRSYSPTEARLIDEGRITTWEEAEDLRVKLNVRPERTLVDCAWDTQNVQAICARYGWQGLIGDNTNKISFPHHEMANGQKIIRNLPFSPVQLGHVGLGMGGIQRQARYFFWCNQPIRALYHRIIDGLTHYKWTEPSDTSEDFYKHRKSEYHKQILLPDGGKKWVYVRANQPDHLLDCDQMNLVSALLDPRIRVLLMSFLDEVKDVPADKV